MRPFGQPRATVLRSRVGMDRAGRRDAWTVDARRRCDLVSRNRAGRDGRALTARGRCGSGAAADRRRVDNLRPTRLERCRHDLGASRVIVAEDDLRRYDAFGVRKRELKDQPRLQLRLIAFRPDAPAEARALVRIEARFAE